MKQNKKILVVDDDADDREMLTDTVARVEPQVEIAYATNGMEALDYLRRSRKDPAALPCLIVLDLNMPLLDGKATFHQLRADADLSHLPVIVFSSSLNPADKEHFNSQGAEFISKPEDLNYLKKIAEHMLNVCCRHLDDTPGA